MEALTGYKLMSKDLKDIDGGLNQFQNNYL